jgi:hypothetical protein
MAKITKTIQREVVKDIRRQLVWINDAINSGDLDYLDELANQLSATAINLTTEVLQEVANEKAGA